MKPKHKFMAGLVLLIAILVIAALTTSFSVPGTGRCGVTASGDLFCQGGSLFQTFSLYDEGGENHECFVDDLSNAGCKVSKDTLSVPAGSQIVHHIDKAVDFVGGSSGWEGYDSCVGFMTHYGCNPKACAFHNAGVCYGLDTDGSDIECGTNRDCDNKYGSSVEMSCMYGRCQSRIIDDSDLDKYKCYKGQIYVVVDGRYKMYGSCMDKYSVAQCSGGFDEITGDNLRDICQADCRSDSDCDSGYACAKVKYTVDGSSKVEEGGRCIIEKAADEEDELFEHQQEILMELQAKATECTQDGGEWTGTDCINKGDDEKVLDSLSEESVADYVVATCKDSTKIWYSEYNTGKRCPGDEVTESPWFVPDASKKEWMWAVVLAVVAALGVVGYFMFSGKKRRRK